MRTLTLHNSANTQATLVALRSQGFYRPVCPAMVMSRPWSNETILVEGAAFAGGSKDPTQEALL
jgi:hypothetical protein